MRGRIGSPIEITGTLFEFTRSPMFIRTSADSSCTLGQSGRKFLPARVNARFTFPEHAWNIRETGITCERQNESPRNFIRATTASPDQRPAAPSENLEGVGVATL